jgi:hypothetical protein
MRAPGTASLITAMAEEFDLDIALALLVPASFS